VPAQAGQRDCCFIELVRRVPLMTELRRNSPLWGEAVRAFGRLGWVFDQGAYVCVILNMLYPSGYVSILCFRLKSRETSSGVPWLAEGGSLFQGRQKGLKVRSFGNGLMAIVLVEHPVGSCQNTNAGCRDRFRGDWF